MYELVGLTLFGCVSSTGASLVSLSAARLVALGRGGGKARPIVIGDVWLRVQEELKRNRDRGGVRIKLPFLHSAQRIASTTGTSPTYAKLKAHPSCECRHTFLKKINADYFIKKQ